MRKVRACGLAVLGFALAACSGGIPSERIAGCTVYDYGNGVRYFYDCHEDYFGKALSEFLKKNPKLEITAIAGKTVGLTAVIGATATVGYFVTTRTKN